MASTECIICDNCGKFMRKEKDLESVIELDLWRALSDIEDDLGLELLTKEGEAVFDICSFKCALNLMSVNEYFLIFLYTYLVEVTPQGHLISMENLGAQNHDWYVWDCWCDEFRLHGKWDSYDLLLDEEGE